MWRRKRLRSQSLKVGTEVHQQDYLFEWLVDHPDVPEPLRYYLEDGRRSAELLRQVLESHVFPRPLQPFEMLEFASGYGRLTRHLADVIPEAAVTASDIHAQAIAFLRHRFSVTAELSQREPAHFNLGREFDLVFALSFFSHMPDHSWGPWLTALYRHVARGGGLLFTTHGEVSRATQISGSALSSDGFWFSAGGEQRDIDPDEYGTAITSIEYVKSQVARCLETDVAYYAEGLWWGHQDVYLVKKAL
jgi:SAM-dependent methyltransferase